MWRQDRPLYPSLCEGLVDSFVLLEHLAMGEARVVYKLRDDEVRLAVRTYVRACVRVVCRR